jgi:hypothetical protein
MQIQNYYPFQNSVPNVLEHEMEQPAGVGVFYVILRVYPHGQAENDI